jgi:uncharacterized repeat protein (TIGR03803 family)
MPRKRPTAAGLHFSHYVTSAVLEGSSRRIRMSDQQQRVASIFDINLRAGLVTAFFVGILATSTLAAPVAQAQTFQIIHTFSGPDGANPMVGLTMDRVGNLYGTTEYGGTAEGYCAPGCGTVFKLGRKGSGWVFNPLYSFQGGSDGAYPEARVIVGPNSSLYGTTTKGGEPGNCYEWPGCGTVFNLKPPPTRPAAVLSPWLETVLYRFQGAPDGSYPMGEVAFDQAGNLDGSTSAGGVYGHIYSGTIFELTPSNGVWTESILYSFVRAEPNGVAFDQVGNLYGTTFELSLRRGGCCGVDRPSDY